MWVLFDESNGNYPCTNYFWRFKTRVEALVHRDFQNSNPNFARLVGPFKCVESNNGVAFWAFDTLDEYGQWFVSKEDALENRKRCIHRLYKVYGKFSFQEARLRLSFLGQLRRYERPKDWKP